MSQFTPTPTTTTDTVAANLTIKPNTVWIAANACLSTHYDTSV